MATFKVICKADKGAWERYPTPTKTITTSKLFGLLKETKIISDPKIVNGPTKDEICIVTRDYIYAGELYYVLSGYPYGGYDSKYFIKLDEFTETQKEIAKKTEVSPN